MNRHRWAALSFALALGCEPSSVTPPSFFGVGDGVALDPERYPLAVTAWWAPPPQSGWSVVEWPEMVEVPTVVGPLVERTEGELWTLPITPVTPFVARWYAWRWEPTTPEEEAHLAGAIPLSDGSYVGRFYGAPIPAVSQVVGRVAESFDVVQVMFTSQVFLDEGYTLEEAVVVAQPGVLCAPVFFGEPGLFVDWVDLACSPRLDWAEPVQVHVEGLASRAGIPIVPFELSQVFPSFAPDEATVIEVDVPLPPPPVPPAFCAGVACEP